MQTVPSLMSGCATCRIRHLLLTQRLLRSGKLLPSISDARHFHQATPKLSRQRHGTTGTHSHSSTASLAPSRSQRIDRQAPLPGLNHIATRIQPTASSAEDVARRARETFGDHLPGGLLDSEQEKVYERLYGKPLMFQQGEVETDESNPARSDDTTTSLHKRSGEGWEEVETAFDAEHDGALEAGSAEHLDNPRLLEDMTAASEYENADEEDDHERNTPDARVHPLTEANRFSTKPSTMFLPREQLVDPITLIASRVVPKHLREAAHRIFGGIGLPHSTSTPSLGKLLQQKPVPIDVSQAFVSEIEGDVFAAVLMPAMFSSIMSVLVETRKRLGTRWAEAMVRKAEEGELRILDAGGAGMGVLAVRELLRAEWERMKEEEVSTLNAVMQAGGRTGGAGISPPLGKATAWVTSDVLRHRASTIVQDTTFIPRMPDYVHTEQARYAGKFDIIVAAHTIWPINEDWKRKLHVENLWSLLNANGGVLCVLEKGVARGFEAVAETRRFLLRARIANSNKQEEQDTSEESDDGDTEWLKSRRQETGMIIAPCTNHKECPMYYGERATTIKGRKDICHFKQRYIRPPFLQNILQARDKNHEDVKISYLSVMRGKDYRMPDHQHEHDSDLVFQGEQATDRAAKGYGHDWPHSPPNEQQPDNPSSLSLPRTVLPPLKRQGHVILDVCTPAGKLERWTVPKSFSKQAFRDARKSSWGDLWALGAKTRIPREAKLGKHARIVEKPKIELSKKAKKAKRKLQERKLYRPDKLMLEEA